MDADYNDDTVEDADADAVHEPFPDSLLGERRSVEAPCFGCA